MAANYENAINQIKGEHFDVAFVPVDPRLGTSYSLGIRYFLENTHVDAVFPMHCWGQYEVCRKLQKEPELNGMLEHYLSLIHILKIDRIDIFVEGVRVID